MKIISCYLENFGCFNQKQFNFNDGLTVINEENGYGKSTLVAFIKAMFYGLDSYRDNYNRDGALPERLHYYPFAGGEYGGNLTFNYNGKEYKIERFFAPKSDTLDTLKVFSNGVETYELGEDIGKAVFGVDKASFERLAFISSDEIEIKSTSSINLKLNEFLNGNDFDISLDDVILKLDKTAKEYKKSRQSRDRLTILQEKISDLTEKITNARFVENSLGNKLVKFDGLKQSLANLSREIETAQKTNELLSDYAHYEELISLKNASTEKVSEILSKYNGQVPSLSEIEVVRETTNKNRELSALISDGLVSGSDNEFEALSNLFKNGVPTDSEIESVEKYIAELSSLLASENLLKAQSSSQREIEIENKFSKNPPSETLIRDIDATFNLYKETGVEIDDATRTQRAVAETKKKPYLLFASIIVLLLAGVGISFVSLIVGLSIVGISLIAFFIALVVAFKPQNSNGLSIIHEKRLKLSEYENKLAFILTQYGYSLDDGVVYAYSSFKRDFADYLSRTQLNEDRDVKLNKLNAEISNISAKLKGYFANFGILSENFVTAIAELKSKINSFISLKERLSVIKKGKEDLTLKISENNLIIKAFTDKYAISTLDINALQTDVNLYIAESEKAKSLSKRALEYKAEKSLAQKPDGVAVNLSELNFKLASLQEELALLSSEIESDEYIVEKIDGLISEKTALEQTLKEYKKNHELLLATKDLLLKAEQNLKDRYVKPVKDEFIKYSNLLEQTLGEKVTMTKDFEITFERNGKERSEKHLSSGVKSICALCFRLALIKNMYKDKSPFLILDDPFVFLDGFHFEKVATLIKELSLDSQILYFTCHKSRTF